ncbi:hypothetical protein [Serratia nevei]|uniref:hypothetical protein n=1 Tax=Serratia nevei TaxID=2703794 RepID=UPI00313D6E08
MDKFREPEQFDAEVEIHDGEPFAVWAPAVNGSHVKAEVYFALLAELEATRKQSQELAKQCGRLGARAAIAERKLATPVRLPEREFDDGSDKQVCILAGRFNSGIDKSAKAIRAAGFKVEGDE